MSFILFVDQNYEIRRVSIDVEMEVINKKVEERIDRTLMKVHVINKRPLSFHSCFGFILSVYFVDTIHDALLY